MCVGGEEHDEQTSMALVVEMVARTGMRWHWKYTAADASVAAAAAGVAGQDNSITIDSLSYITTYWVVKYIFCIWQTVLSKTTPTPTSISSCTPWELNP